MKINVVINYEIAEQIPDVVLLMHVFPSLNKHEQLLLFQRYALLQHCFCFVNNVFEHCEQCQQRFNNF